MDGTIHNKFLKYKFSDVVSSSMTIVYLVTLFTSYNFIDIVYIRIVSQKCTLQRSEQKLLLANRKNSSRSKSTLTRTSEARRTSGVTLTLLTWALYRD